MRSIANLRLASVEFRGVPDIISVSYAILDLDARIAELKENIISNIQHTQNIVIGGEIWKFIAFITKKYRLMRVHDISDVDFYRACAYRDFDEILTTFGQIMMGTIPVAQSTDFMTAYKEVIASGGSRPCLPEYNNQITYMKNEILTVDQLVTEAWIWTLRYTSTDATLPEDEQVQYMAYTAFTTYPQRYSCQTGTLNYYGVFKIICSQCQWIDMC